jgi:hypothetical protein
VPRQGHSGEVFFLKKGGNTLPECLGWGTRERGLTKKIKFLPRVLHSTLGEEDFYEKSQISFPSAKRFFKKKQTASTA